MTDATRDQRLPLCPACANNQSRAHCIAFPVTCLEQRDIWDEAAAAERWRIELEIGAAFGFGDGWEDVLSIVRGEHRKAV